MLSWDEIVQGYTVKYSDRVKKITKPLMDRFGISCFFYIRINNRGQLIWLGNRPDCAEYYVDQKYFFDDPCMMHPDNWQSGCSLLGTVASETYQRTFIEETKNLFNLNSWIILSKKELEFVELFGFVGEKRSCIEKIYLNHSNLLKSFAVYFKKEMQPVIRRMEEESISLADLKGEDFYTGSPIHPTIAPTIYQDFLEDCGMRSQIKKAALLSKRERQCLKSLLLGKSAKETATDLNLSSRTIEFYFENIKNKLICRNKYEVFSFSRELEDLGLL
jgi:DNA-binding CsgD family transcriptional regulator